MGSTRLNKKRKLRDAESVAAAVAATKKSKKLKSPAPPVDPPSEDDEEDDDESAASEEETSEQLEQDGDGESEDGASALEEGDEAADDSLPKDSAPLLPPTTNSDLFEDLSLSEKTMRSIKEMGFTKMTNIQRSVSDLLTTDSAGQRVLTTDLGNTATSCWKGRPRCGKDGFRKDAGLPDPRG